MQFKIKKAFFCLSVLIGISVSAEEKTSNVSLNGQVTSWAVSQFYDPYVMQLGMRFVPTLLGNFVVSDKSKFDFEASLNINTSANFSGLNYDNGIAQLKPYRIWARYAADNWEVRGGLQKINFGSAKLFRPLMWFDAMDVRDPLQLTDGVYGVLGRYYLQNNANIWFWTLMGNDRRKGWEMMSSEQWKPEVGGRIEIPIATGEMALSANYRKVHAINMVSSRWNDFSLLNESRIGLDGKWDVGVGLWFENSTTITQQNNIMIPRFQDMWNVGADYTFPIGNGVGVTVEYLRYHIGDQIVAKGTTMNLVGTMINYPLSILDNISAMVFYVPEAKLMYNYVSWNRMYDNWSLYAIGFWNPVNYQLLTSQNQSSNLFAGKGLQLMVSYNF
jgi:hypothetical protein